MSKSRVGLVRIISITRTVNGFNRERGNIVSGFGIGPKNPHKSEAELAMDAAMDAYYEHFGERYGAQIGGPSMSMEETTEEIYRLIAENRKQPLITYKEGLDY